MNEVLVKPLEIIQSFDVSLISKLFAAKRYPELLPISRWLSTSGDGLLYVLIGAMSLSLNGADHGYFWALLLAFLLERPLYFVLKNGLKRDRPYQVLAIKNHVNPSDQFSFPSGHTSAAFVFAVITATHWPVLWLPLLVWAAAVGCSRVVLGVHYPTDILVGACMGVCMALLPGLMIS